MSDSNYAHPEVLVETDWVALHLSDPKVRIVESDEDVLLYDIGHVPGAVKVDWHTDLNDPIIRDYLDSERFAALLQAKGFSTNICFPACKHSTANFEWVDTGVAITTASTSEVNKSR